MNDARPCAICSRRNGPADREVFHRHFSSLFLRRLTGAEDVDREYLCPSCMRQHFPYPDQRLRVVVTDSTLHQFFAPPGYTELQYDGDILHVDYISIAEADIRTLKNAFRAEYLDNSPSSKPMDVVLVAGYVDIMNGYGRN